MSQEADFLWKVVVIGESGVGKTNLMTRFAYNKFSQEHQSTIGVEFAVKMINLDNKTAKVQIWDTAGQERFRAISTAYYRDAKAALLVYDITKRDTFEQLPKWIKEIREQAEQGIPILLCGNKTDLDHLRENPTKEAESFAEKNKALFFETSAKDGVNVDSAFMKLINEIYAISKGETTISPIDNNSIIKITDEKKNSDHSGCSC